MEVDSQASPQSVVVVVLASLVVPVSQPAVLRAASIFLLPASTVTPHIPTDLVMNQREGERERQRERYKHLSTICNYCFHKKKLSVQIIYWIF